MPDRDDPNSPHATQPNLNGRVARLEIDVEKVRVAQEYGARVLDERFRAIDVSIAGLQRSLDAIQLLISNAQANPEASPMVREWRQWRDKLDARVSSLDDASQRQAGALALLKFVGLSTAVGTVISIVVLILRISTGEPNFAN